MKGSVGSSLYTSIPNHQYLPLDPKSCPDLPIAWVPAPSFCLLVLPAAGFVRDTLHCPPQALHWCLCPPHVYLHVELSGAPAMCSHFKGFCFPASQPASLAVLGLLPRLQHPAWLVSPQLQLQLPCCASGRRHAGVCVGGFLPLGLSSPYYISL